MNSGNALDLVTTYAHAGGMDYHEELVLNLMMGLRLAILFCFVYLLIMFLRAPVRAWRQSTMYRRAKRRAWRDSVDTPYIHLHGRFKVKRKRKRYYRRAEPLNVDY